jgi:[ribosomal protein S5]-alanine N-acetyltransferase
MKIFAETERLILREMLPEDEMGLYELDSDPEVHRYLGNKPIHNIEQARESIRLIREQYIDHGIGRWAIIEKSTNGFIGWAGLKFVKEKINNHTNYYDLGYRLIKKYWGKGFATEVATASLNYGFDKLKLPEIFAMADIENAGSNNVLKKLGLKLMDTFEYDGVVHNWYHMERNIWMNKNSVC